MRLEQIDHVALTCASLEAAREWYVRVLGFEHVFPNQWDGVPVFLRLGTTFVALFPSKGSVRNRGDVRVDHLAFRAATRADFENAQNDLRAHGVSFEFQDHEISHSIYFADPDGHTLEITTYDVARNNSAAKIP